MPQLIVVEQGKEERESITCTSEVMGIGRLGTNYVVLNHEAVSRQHAQVLPDGSDFFLQDLGSDNGTLLNSSLIHANEKYLLRDGDVITINGFHIHFSRADQLEQSFNDVTDSEIVEVKMLKKVLRALDKDTLPSLEVLNGNAEGKRVFFADDQSAMVLGRDRACEFAIDEYIMSRQHAKLTRRGKAIVVEDLQSKNGTYVNNARIAGEHILRDGDRLACGTIIFLFRNPQDVNLDEVSEELRQQHAPTPTESPEDTGDDIDNDDDEEDVTNLSDETPDFDAVDPQSGAAANDYPTPEARQSFLARFSIAELGLLWAGIMVFLITTVLIVQLFT